MASPPHSEFPDISHLDYLELARQWANSSLSAERRTAGDRAYFAMYLFARDRLIERGYGDAKKYQQARGHRAVANDLFKGLGSTELSEAERLLRWARSVLTYDIQNTQHSLSELKLPVGENTLGWMIATAEKLVQAIENLPHYTDIGQEQPDSRESPL